MIEKLIASVESQVLERWLHVTTPNANLSGFIIPVLTLLMQLKENGIAKIARNGKIKNMIWQQYLHKTTLNQPITCVQ